jgi:hypothetical protein
VSGSRTAGSRAFHRLRRIAASRPRWWWLVAFAFFYVFPYYPRVHNANELPRAYLVKSIVDHRRIDIDPGVARWGTTVDVSPWNGHSYSNKAPGTSFLTAPFYALLRLGGEPTIHTTVWLGRVITGLLPTLLLLALLPGVLARFGVGPPAAQLTLVTYALGSMALPFSYLYISHQPSAVALALAWILAQKVADSVPRAPGAVAAGPPMTSRQAAGWMALAGTAAGWAPVCDYQAAFALPLLTLLVAPRVWRRPDRLRLFAVTLAAAALPIALMLAYHQAAFDSPWRTGYDASVTFASFHQQGFLGITSLRWIAFQNSMVGPDNGLITFAPWLLLALPGFVLLWRRGHRAEAATFAGIAALYILFLSSITFWRGGWQMGPRYIIAMLPFLLPPIALALQAFTRRPLGQVLVLSACFFGVLVYAGSSAQFPYFPERFINPLHEVTVRLWREGFAAPNPLNTLGVPGPWSLLPYIAAVVAAMATSARGVTASWRPVAVALVLAIALFAALRLAPFSKDGEHGYQWVRRAATI